MSHEHIQRKKGFFLKSFIFSCILSLSSSFSALADQQTGAPGQKKDFFQDVPLQSMMASSPITDYTVHVIVYVLVIGVLVSILLLGAFAVINIGLLSKREEDTTGRRDPSDVGLFKHAAQKTFLPAEEGEIIDHTVSLQTRRASASQSELLREDEMFQASSHDNRAA